MGRDRATEKGLEYRCSKTIKRNKLELKSIYGAFTIQHLICREQVRVQRVVYLLRHERVSSVADPRIDRPSRDHLL
ncbi:hypothetical protein TNCV_3104951 [Trichonephila clavipes]|nr:hypothetical protein TNCV_3104951 [Trichonephila clavipes]